MTNEFCTKWQLGPKNVITQIIQILSNFYPTLGSGSGSTERTQFQSDSTIKGVISSFVEVEEYKKKGNLDVSYFQLL